MKKKIKFAMLMEVEAEMNEGETVDDCLDEFGRIVDLTMMLRMGSMEIENINAEVALESVGYENNKTADLEGATELMEV